MLQSAHSNFSMATVNYFLQSAAMKTPKAMYLFLTALLFTSCRIHLHLAVHTVFPKLHVTSHVTSPSRKAAHCPLSVH